jgi:chromosome segregation ATPase
MTILATPTGQDLAALGRARATAYGALDALHAAKADAQRQLDAADGARAALQTQHAQLALDAALGLGGAQAQLEAVERRAEELQRETSRAQRVIVGADARIPEAKAALRSGATAEAHAKLGQLAAAERARIDEVRGSADRQDAAPEPIGTAVSAKYQDVYRAARQAYMFAQACFELTNDRAFFRPWALPHALGDRARHIPQLQPNARREPEPPAEGTEAILAALRASAEGQPA